MPRTSRGKSPGDRSRQKPKQTRRPSPAAPSAPGSGPGGYVGRAYAQIKSWILDSSFNPGETISDAAVAAQLGISRTPAREALRQLELEGLVLHSPHRGWRVRIAQPEDIEEIFQIKAALEAMLVRQATARLTADVKAVLVEAMDAMDAAAGRGDVQGWREADRRLVRTLYAAAGNRRALEMVLSLNVQWHLIWLRLISLEDWMQHSVREHRKILEFALAGDADGAARSQEEHVTSIKRYLLNLLTNFVMPLTEGMVRSRQRRSARKPAG